MILLQWVHHAKIVEVFLNQQTNPPTLLKKHTEGLGTCEGVLETTMPEWTTLTETGRSPLAAIGYLRTTTFGHIRNFDQ